MRSMNFSRIKFNFSKGKESKFTIFHFSVLRKWPQIPDREREKKQNSDGLTVGAYLSCFPSFLLGLFIVDVCRRDLFFKEISLDTWSTMRRRSRHYNAARMHLRGS